MQWFEDHPGLMRAAGIVVAVLSVVSLIGLPILVARIPADYFAHLKPPPSPFAERHPVLRFLFHATRAVLGVVLLVLGVAMLVLPGQGVLTLLVAVVLLEFPGKRRLELGIVRRPRVLAALNWIRRKAGREPLQVADPDADTMEP